VQDLCLVIPCFNEARRLDARALAAFVDGTGASLCFVNDGSRDATGVMLDELAAARAGAITVLHLPSNAGKAEAVRRGMLHALEWKTFAWIGYWDADLAAPLGEASALYATGQAHDTCRVVLGSRIRRLGAAIERHAWRHYTGRVFATAASLTLRLPVYDTQCGAKLVRADTVASLCAEPFTSRWLFDVELLARLRRVTDDPATAAIEHPLTAWRHSAASKLTAGAMLRAPLDLWRIARRYRRERAR
jgi:dolichyl-phosphate beta-glucosyltransferase